MMGSVETHETSQDIWPSVNFREQACKKEEGLSQPPWTGRPFVSYVDIDK